MALKLVTAPPGTGKTLYLIKMIFEYLNQGRRVYSNIDQLKIEEVVKIDSNADWRDLPDGSVVIFDEAQEHPAFSDDPIIPYPEYIESDIIQNESENQYRKRLIQEKKRYDREYKQHLEQIKDIARALQIHRHFGFDIILATQHPSLLNRLTLNIVGEHYHLIRPFNAKACTIFFWRRKQDNPDSADAKKNVEWKKTIKFNKHYFHLYRSANVHTHKLQIPIKYLVYMMFAMLLIGSPFYLASKSEGLKMLVGAKQEKKEDVIVNKEMPKDLTTFKAPVESKLPDQSIESTRIAMISESSVYCRAYSGTGDLLDIEDELCRKLSKNPRQLRASTVKREMPLDAANQTLQNGSSTTMETTQQSFSNSTGSVTYNPTKL